MPPVKKHVCSMVRVQKMVSGKWKLLILWYLWEETRRFNALRRLMEDVSQRVLTQQLRELERDGLVNRKIYMEIPPKVEYSLTARGRSLTPLLDWLTKWGHKYLPPEK